MRSDDGEPRDLLRDKIIGLGERSFRKSYYPELQRRLADLERFRALLDESSDAILTINVFDGRLTDVNGSVCRYLGMDRATLLKMTAYDLIDSATADRIVRLFTGQDECMNITVEMRGSGGRTIPFEFTVKIVSLNGVSHAVAVGRDITERKRAEEHLANARLNLERSLKFTEALLSAIPTPVFYKDREGRYLGCNRAFSDLMGVTSDEIKGKTVVELWPGEHAAIYHQKDLEVMETQAIQIYEYKVRDKNGTDRPIIFVKSVFRDENEEVAGVVGAFLDITERKQAEDQIRASLVEKEVLLKEIHHRVKNNLQIISSLLSIQAHYLADSRDLELFRRSQDRIRSMALVHEKLYQTDDLAVIDFSQYVESLVGSLLTSCRGDADNVRLNVDVAGVFLDIDTAIPCGLIINELVSNALKHAFPGGRAGQLTVYMRQDEESFVLEVSDDGTGLTHPVDIEKSHSMGLKLVTLLTGQLDGTISVDTSCGTKFRIMFKGTKDHTTGTKDIKDTAIQ